MKTSLDYDALRAQVRASMAGSDHKVMMQQAAKALMKPDM